jgi:hypothetical protein
LICSGRLSSPTDRPFSIRQPNLGGDHYLVPYGGERFSDEFLVDVWPVYLGSVEERDA